MDVFTRKCIYDHRNPIVKICLPAQKFLIGAKNEEEIRGIEDHQKYIKAILEHHRVEKRAGRAQALWLPNKNISEVTKVVKNLVKYFGFQNKNGIFIYPEEMLFLLETNRLEVTFHGNALSIEKAYEIVFKMTNITLSKYRIYKKLALLGYRLKRFEPTVGRVKEQNNVKRVLEEPDELQCNKRIKDSPHKRTHEQNYPDNKDVLPKEHKYVLDIFNKITEIMPVDSQADTTCLKPDYSIFSPTSLSKSEPDFYLFISEEGIQNQRYKNKVPCMSASCIDDVAFYTFSDVHLPYI